MAFSLIGQGNSSNVPVCTYFCDVEDDMDSIDVDTIPMGSAAYIIGTAQLFILNSEKEWTLQ